MKEKIIESVKNIFTFLMSPIKEKYVLKPILVMTMIFGLISIVGFEVVTYYNRGLGAVAWLVCLSIGALVGGFYLIALLVSLVKEVPISTWFFIGPVLCGLYYIFSSNRAPNGTYIALVMSVYLIFFVSYMITGIYNIIRHKRFLKLSKFYKIMIHGMAIICFIGVYYVFFTGGFKGQLYENAFETYKTEFSIEEKEAVFNVQEGVYGSKDYIDEFGDVLSEESYSTNIGYFLGSFGESKEEYLGFNTRNVPLNAHYYLPDGDGPFPVVLIVHGNHEMVQRSEIGYGYLGRYLAARGYAVFSVDENFLNYSMYDSEIKDDKTLGENDARAYILLEHLRYLDDADNNYESVFYNKLDTESIALMGHSRGGEAVAVAEFFNHVKHLPSNSKKRLSRDYGIKSIVAIAPTDGQYRPGQRPTEIEDVNYLLLHGTHDMDVTYVAGSNQYERVNLSSPDFFKSQVIIYGGNHGQFNSEWSVGDNNPVANKLHNTGQLISRSDQENTASQLIYYFLEATLKDQKKYVEGFRNLKAFKDLPDNLYLSQYHESKDLVIVDYTEDNYLETTTIGSGVIYQNGLSSWREGLSKLDGRDSQIYGTYLETTDLRSGKYIINLFDAPIDSSSYDKLYLTLSDETKDSDNSYDFDIEIKDDKDNVAIISLSSYGELQHKLDIKLSKFEYFDKQLRDESMFQTFELPFGDFEFESFNWNKIKMISLIFPEEEKRKIFLKDLGIR